MNVPGHKTGRGNGDGFQARALAHKVVSNVGNGTQSRQINGFQTAASLQELVFNVCHGTETGHVEREEIRTP